MGMKVNASDLMPDPNAAAREARAPAREGALAPRRASRAPSGRAARRRRSRRRLPKRLRFRSLRDFGDFGDEDDFSPTLGDTVRIKKTGVVGVVVDNDGGVLSVQSGRNTLKSPVEGVELAAAGAGGGSGGKKKQKKQKKKGSGLPSSVAKSATQKRSSGASKPAARSGSADVNDLMAKFNRK